MTKNTHSKPPEKGSRSGQVIIKSLRSGNSKTSFGRVTVHGPKASKLSVKEGADRSHQSLKRATKVIAKSGISLRVKKGVPLYFLDADDPEIVYRKLNGTTDRGRFVDGHFKVHD